MWVQMYGSLFYKKNISEKNTTKNKKLATIILKKIVAVVAYVFIVDKNVNNIEL